MENSEEEDLIFLKLIDESVNKLNSNLEKSVVEDIANSLSKILEIHKFCIINDLNSVEKKYISEIWKELEPEKIYVIDENDFSKKIFFDENVSKWKINFVDSKFAYFEKKSIINIVFGGEMDRIRSAADKYPDSKFLFLAVSKRNLFGFG